MTLTLIILAAGQGSRMLSDRPKVLHDVAGAPLIAHAIRAGAALDPDRIVVVVGHGAQAVGEVARDADPRVEIVVQAQQRGTGHAVAQAAALLDGSTGDAVVLYGDTPLLTEGTLHALLAARARHDVVVLGFEPADPARYGRLVMDGDRLARIVEWRDATAVERALPLCNSGVVAADCATLLDMVAGLKSDNAAGEYYLTDIVAAAQRRGLSAGVVTCPEAETLGVNTRADLARAEAAFQSRARALALAAGVTLTAPDTVFFAWDSVAGLGRDAVIEPNVVFGPGVTVESGAVIRAFCHLEGCHVSMGATVGPFARLRPGAELGDDVHVGNFVEIKNAVLDRGAKVGHLTYIGDAHIGEGANIGAGTVTCNYDGAGKYHTDIGAGTFVGAGTLLVAPVSIGAGAITGTGSVITTDVPADALALGRAPQVTKPGYAPALREAARRRKADHQRRADHQRNAGQQGTPDHLPTSPKATP